MDLRDAMARRKMSSGRTGTGRTGCIGRFLALALGSLILAVITATKFSKMRNITAMASCFTVPWNPRKCKPEARLAQPCVASSNQAQPGPASGETQNSWTQISSTLEALSSHAFLISTSCSEQRRFDALATLSKVCTPQVRIFERDENGARGCYFSHLSIYREALQKDLPWALILEDNLILTQPVEQVCELIAGMVQWASNSSNWSVLHLSLVHSAASLRLRPVEIQGEVSAASVVKVERTAPDWYGPVSIERAPGLGTTAYIISDRAMQQMLDLDSSDSSDSSDSDFRPIDDLLAERFAGSTYATFPAPLHRGQTASLINPDQQLFRSVMYDERIFKAIESALVWTGLSSSQLVWFFLASMAAWTFGVTLPVVSFLFK